EAKQYDAALAELDRLEPDPDADSLALRADILIARKKPDDALDALRRAVALAPRRLDLREGLGRTYLEKKDYASAQKELQAVLASDRDNVPAWKDLSTAYYLDGNCPAALAALQELERREPLSAGAWFVRATCYDKLKNVPEAIAAYEKFREVDQGRDFNQDWQAEQRLKTLRRIQDKKH
ncbi:MAG TPA: tetratricopeptide repeat protein, partial [Methylomirabilota bacterium]|nr:tetratricopeptide repeat protein [Methylomirabilota bacterium]